MSAITAPVFRPVRFGEVIKYTGPDHESEAGALEEQYANICEETGVTSFSNVFSYADLETSYAVMGLDDNLVVEALDAGIDSAKTSEQKVQREEKLFNFLERRSGGFVLDA